MADHDIEIVHERLTELTKILADLAGEVRESNGLCKFCRPKVLGNGTEGFDARLARVETIIIKNGEHRVTVLEATDVASAWWLTKMLAACAIIASLIATSATLITKLFAN